MPLPTPPTAASTSWISAWATEYKRVYCNENEDLFDSFIPLSPKKGQAIVQILRAQGGLKRFVKATPALWKAAKTVRGLFSR